MPFFRSTLFACKHIYSIFDVSFKCYSSTTRSLLCVCIWAVQSIEAWNFYFEYVLTDNNVVQKQHANIQCHQHCIWKACLCPFEFIKCQILMRTVQCSVLFAYLYYFFSLFAFQPVQCAFSVNSYASCLSLGKRFIYCFVVSLFWNFAKKKSCPLSEGMINFHLDISKISTCAYYLNYKMHSNESSQLCE